MFSNLRKKTSQFGPGLLYAGAAVGVSHLVQSTRAGADFGFTLILVVFLANLVKYPLFEIGPRYAAVTGQTLLDGYRKLGRWAVLVYMLMTISTMFVIMAAITMVTAGLFHQITGYGGDTKLLALILLLSSAFILVVGRYSVLDRMMKLIIILLTVCTMVALMLAVIEPVSSQEQFMTKFSFGEKTHVMFLVALIGWMPAPIDLVIWHSVWSVSKNKERGSRIALPDALRDFKVGYWGTTFLALAFLSLGALMMYGSGTKSADSAVGFAEQIMRMYTQNIGEWAFPFISIAAFTTMFSTMLTCLDAFPRTLRKSGKLILPALDNKRTHQSIYRFLIVITIIGTAVVLYYFTSEMKELVDFATTISFLLAPILAILNFVVMKKADVSQDQHQPKWLAMSGLGSIFILTAISVWYMIYQF